MKQPSGYVIYEGPSMLTGEPIVAILTLKSKNVKTGNVSTIWYLPKNTNPLDAINTGEDEAVCGKCPHRKGSCYVTLFQAPNNIHKAYLKNVYPRANPEEVSHLVSNVRFGGWGDPASVPDAVNRPFVKSKTKAGYTHQWKAKGFDKRVLDYCQASIDTEGEVGLFQLMYPHKKYFRVKAENARKLPWEVQCPATVKNSTVNCKDCGLCDGNSANVVTDVHGSRSVVNVYMNGLGKAFK